MQVYKYDEKTKEYIGTEQALINPLESELQGKTIYLLPANATFEKPNLQEGFASVFNGTQWENIEDNIGKEYWLDTDTFGTPAKTMKDLGAFPAGAMFTAPAKTLEQLKADKVQATLVSTGIIPFMEGMQYLELKEDGKEGKQYCISMKLSPAFVKFSRKHSVPINYSVYKKITSAVGKDIYAWLTYRNNSLKPGDSVFIPSNSLVEQFMPVKEKSHENQERTNYNYILEQIRIIKEKYYPELNVAINKDGDGVTLYHSLPQILSKDSRYVLVTASM